MPIQGIPSPAVPYGSVVVISGSTGFIGSHVTDQALAAGYKVRGTTRDVKKASWAVELFEKRYGKGVFELVEVKDMQGDGAFDGVCDGEFAGSLLFALDLNVALILLFLLVISPISFTCCRLVQLLLPASARATATALVCPCALPLVYLRSVCAHSSAPTAPPHRPCPVPYSTSRPLMPQRSASCAGRHHPLLSYQASSGS